MAKAKKDDGGALVIRAPNGKLYFVNDLESFVITSKTVDAEDFPIDLRAVAEGDFECWPCKRKGP
jgi:hypothetical protein